MFLSYTVDAPTFHKFCVLKASIPDPDVVKKHLQIWQGSIDCSQQSKVILEYFVKTTLNDDKLFAFNIPQNIPDTEKRHECLRLVLALLYLSKTVPTFSAFVKRFQRLLNFVYEDEARIDDTNL